MSRLKVAIAGAGTVVRRFHFPTFLTNPEVEIVAICDPDVDRAKDLAARAGGAKAYASLDEALASHRPDIASICSPPQFHLAQTKAAVEAGAHVLLEKPMAMNMGEADELSEIVRQTDRRVTVVHNFKFRAALQKTMAAAKSGEIGKILRMQRIWLLEGDRDRMTSEPDFWCHQLAGGRWGETLPHDIYLALELFGELKLGAVAAKKVSKKWPWLPADEVSLIFESGEAMLDVEFSANCESSIGKYTALFGTTGVLIAAKGDPIRLPAPRGGEPKKKKSKEEEPPSGMRAVAQAVRALFEKKRPSKGEKPKEPKPEKKESDGDGEDDLSPAAAKSSGHRELINRYVDHVLGKCDSPVSWDEAYTTMRLAYEAGKAIEAKVS